MFCLNLWLPPFPKSIVFSLSLFYRRDKDSQKSLVVCFTQFCGKKFLSWNVNNTCSASWLSTYRSTRQSHITENTPKITRHVSRKENSIYIIIFPLSFEPIICLLKSLFWYFVSKHRVCRWKLCNAILSRKINTRKRTWTDTLNKSFVCLQLQSKIIWKYTLVTLQFLNFSSCFIF